MNIQEYISSGIVESYVLGLADNAERGEFERICAAHSEVLQAREAFEIVLEQAAMLNAVHPSHNLKSKIFAQIDIDADQMENKGAQVTAMLDVDRQPRDNYRIAAVSGFTRYLAAASVALLLVSTGLNFYFFNRYKEYNSRYEALVSSQRELVSNNQVLQTRLQDYEKAFDWMKDPNMAIVKMPAVPTAPDPASATTIYWDTVSRDVYLVVNQLPSPAAGQQYQLWALVDGVPVDAGIFDIKEGTYIQKMKNIPKAQAFAITLEKKGGSPSPTMEKMYVLGKV